MAQAEIAEVTKIGAAVSFASQEYTRRIVRWLIAASVLTDLTTKSAKKKKGGRLHADGPQLSSADGPQMRSSTDGPQMRSSTDGPQMRSSTDGPQMRSSTDGPQMRSSTDGPQMRSSTDGPQKRSSTDGPQRSSTDGLWSSACGRLVGGCVWVSSGTPSRLVVEVNWVGSGSLRAGRFRPLWSAARPWSCGSSARVGLPTSTTFFSALIQKKGICAQGDGGRVRARARERCCVYKEFLEIVGNGKPTGSV